MVVALFDCLFIPVDEGIVKAKFENEIAQFILDLVPRIMVGIWIGRKDAQ